MENAGCIIATAILLLIMIALDIRRIHRFLNKLGISLVASGTFCIVSNIIINLCVKIQNIKILNESISSVLTLILNDILGTILFSGIVIALVGIIFIVISNVIISIRHINLEKKENYK